MLTKLTIRNFKRFDSVEIELGSPVVFVGPNNSGKTTALQALSLWDLAVKRWLAKRSPSEKGGKPTPEKRPGVAINRQDLFAVPEPNAALLWRNLRTRLGERGGDGKPKTKNIRIEVLVDGVTDGRSWQCGFELDYANEESFYCRPMRKAAGDGAERMEVPEDASRVRLAYLPPMSGLTDREHHKQGGEIDFLVGQGKTAEVLRNLCFRVDSEPEESEKWKQVRTRMKDLFGIDLQRPILIAERSVIELSYRDRGGVVLDISASGRGLQQTLLLLAYLAGNPRTVLLLDEPDAHLEVLRQRQVYQLLSEHAREQQSQIVVASHSEVILNEAGDRDVVVAFLGRPHRIDDRGSQLLKALKHIGFDQYYQAEQMGWVLYLEGSTDLAILHALAARVEHPVLAHLQRPAIRYVQNQLREAENHFYGLTEAKSDLVGVALFDRLDKPLVQQERGGLRILQWHRREIENYLVRPEVLLRFAAESLIEDGSVAGPLFASDLRERRSEVMQSCIDDFVPGAARRDPADVYWINTKITDDLLDRLFPAFYERLGLPNLMRKTDYHQLAFYLEPGEIDPEVVIVLDAVLEVASRSKPAAETV